LSFLLVVVLFPGYSGVFEDEEDTLNEF